MSDIAIDKATGVVAIGYLNCVPGMAGTTRANISVEGIEPTHLLMFLDHQCDAQGIQGIQGVVQHREGTEICTQLVLGRGINAEIAAAHWVDKVNGVLAMMSQEDRADLTRRGDPVLAMAVSGTAPRVFGHKGGDDPSPKGEDGGDHLRVTDDPWIDPEGDPDFDD